MFIIATIDKPDEEKFLYDLMARYINTNMKPPNIADESSIIYNIAR